MNFQQLRIIRETVRRNFNLTEVANALYTSQSGVSKHIKDLEDELGVELFVRRGKRLLGLTEPGKELVGIVERMLLDAKNIKRLAEQFADGDQGELTIATTHTQARYALPQVVVEVQASVSQACTWCCTRRARRKSSRCCSTAGRHRHRDRGAGGEPRRSRLPVLLLASRRRRARGHALEHVKPLTLEAVAEYPMITYHEGFTGRARIDADLRQGAARAGHRHVGARCGRDQDLCELGLGVGIIASMAFEPSATRG